MRKVNYFEKKRIEQRRNIQRLMDRKIIEEREKSQKEIQKKEKYGLR